MSERASLWSNKQWNTNLLSSPLTHLSLNDSHSVVGNGPASTAIVNSLRQEIAQLKHQNEGFQKEIMTMTNRTGFTNLNVNEEEEDYQAEEENSGKSRNQFTSNHNSTSRSHATTPPSTTMTLTNLNPDPMFSESVHHIIKPGVTTIGSHSSNNIQLVSEDIFPHHCVISYEPKSTLLMMTANHPQSITFVNGTKIPTNSNSNSNSKKNNKNFSVSHMEHDSLKSVVVRPGERAKRASLLGDSSDELREMAADGFFVCFSP